MTEYAEIGFSPEELQELGDYKIDDVLRFQFKKEI